jgi:hypothetical protein
MKLLLVIATVFLAGCATLPQFSVGYDFLNQKLTIAASPGDGKSVVK